MNDITNLLELQSFYEDVMQDEALDDSDIEEMNDFFEDVYDDPIRMIDVPVNEDRYER